MMMTNKEDSLSWYHPSLSREEAEKVLRDGKWKLEFLDWFYFNSPIVFVIIIFQMVGRAPTWCETVAHPSVTTFSPSFTRFVHTC